MAQISFETNVEPDYYGAPSEWMMLGGQGKGEHVIELCERNGIKPKTMLEVGAGEGAILRHLAARSFCGVMHALEISPSGVKVMLEQGIPGLASCQIFDGYKLPFSDKSFDLVVLSHVLEHVEFERALLRELRRVSRYQVIEIPMDCNALGDENYHFLGPSYGHLNPHTPDSLRFLLFTEHFVVMDEMLGKYSLAALEHEHFVLNNYEPTQEAVARFRNDFRESEAAFNVLPRAQKLGGAAFCALLSRPESDEERMMRALPIVRRYIDSGQPQHARLVFGRYVLPDYTKSKALEIARGVMDTNPKIALEFVDKVLTLDRSSAEALNLRSSILKRIDDEEPTEIPIRTMDDRVPTGAKAWLKTRLPFVIRLAKIFRAFGRALREG